MRQAKTKMDTDFQVAGSNLFFTAMCSVLGIQYINHNLHPIRESSGGDSLILTIKCSFRALEGCTGSFRNLGETDVTQFGGWERALGGTTSRNPSHNTNTCTQNISRC